MIQHILNAKHCQRNWADTHVPTEVTDDILECGRYMPTKQSKQHYDLVCVRDKIARKQINKWCVDKHESPNIHKNPQAQAPVLLLWFKQHSDLVNRNGDPEHSAAEISMGLSIGACMLRANELGLRTGCCICIRHKEIQHFLESYTGDPWYAVYDSKGNKNRKLSLLMGLGYAHPDSTSHIQQMVDGKLVFRKQPYPDRNLQIKYI